MISGYLIAQSWPRSPSAQEFVVKRVARIYPGCWVAFAFSLLVGRFSPGRRASDASREPCPAAAPR